ncbi:MAG: RNA-binding S4 domain-containing protein [Syntrophobacteraceae bacterium]|nr:RNA-binding S4 domain-containing protein [Desulfobacteraceae bacterium]
MVEKFVLESDYIELIKLLKVMGLCETGGMAKMAVSEGRVTVDGAVELRKRCKITRGRKVAFDGKIIEVE